MLSIHKTTVAAVAAGALIAGVGPAQALTTVPSDNPITNPAAVVPLATGSVGLNAKGFNQLNFASVWAGAPAGLTPQLTDVRLFTKGTLSGSFTVENYNPTATIPVSNPSLTFKQNSNGMFTGDLNTSNTTGSVPVATTTSIPGQFIPSTDPPGPPSSPACPAGWTSTPFPGSGVLWNCSSTTTTPGQATFQINPTEQVSTNWSLIGGTNTNPVASSFWSGNTVSIPSFISLTFPSFTPIAQSATFTLNGSGADNYLVYSYIYANTEVPAPLPVVGAGLAFGFSRRLRRRIKSSATIAS